VRRNSVPEHQESRVDDLYKNGLIDTEYGDLLDVCSLERVIKSVRPDEIYNLGAQSHVRISYDVPQFTVSTNALGVLNLLEVYRQNCPTAKFYQASSSEMFGRNIDEDGFQREDTPMDPVSPYGCAKVFGYNIVRNYRRGYKLFATNGILFNHESPRRGSNFVTNKVVKAAVRIKAGLQEELELGNMDSYRDWGHSKDYVRAMHMILQHSEPDDFVISTGKTHSIRELCQYVFSNLDLDYKKYVKQNPKYMRPEELKYLRGDSSKARSVLKWEPKYTFETLLDDMIQHWKSIYNVD
jgi:GDPmannose 4,6-dehydratase